MAKRPDQSGISTIIDLIERVTLSIGHAAAWLLFAMAGAETLVVVMRYGFDLGSIALQESIIYMHAAVFLLGAAYTLKEDGHVRVDVIYRSRNTRQRAWINLAGSVLFLLPVALFILWASLPYVAQAWSIKEASADAGGIAGVYLLKTLIPVFAGLLLLQGLAEALRSIQQLQDSRGA